MATTTNYGWTTPDNTDLVKDGASAIRTLGSSIDTTLKAQIDAQIPDSLLTTKGDLIAATGASTPARLGVGSNDQILVADSTAATGMKWATPAGGGGQTLLSTTTLSGTSTTISSINQTYNDLYVYVFGAVFSAGQTLYMEANGSYGLFYAVQIRNQGGAGGTSVTSSADFDFYVNSSSNGSSTNSFALQFPSYSTTNRRKCFTASGTALNNTGGGTEYAWVGGGGLKTTSALTQIRIYPGSGSFSGGTVLIYGVK
jgi:hypothetical protein